MLSKNYRTIHDSFGDEIDKLDNEDIKTARDIINKYNKIFSKNSVIIYCIHNKYEYIEINSLLVNLMKEYEKSSFMFIIIAMSMVNQCFTIR